MLVVFAGQGKFSEIFSWARPFIVWFFDGIILRPLGVSCGSMFIEWVWLWVGSTSHVRVKIWDYGGSIVSTSSSESDLLSSLRFFFGDLSFFMDFDWGLIWIVGLIGVISIWKTIFWVAGVGIVSSWEPTEVLVSLSVPSEAHYNGETLTIWSE